jgi:hypothetical protein
MLAVSEFDEPLETHLHDTEFDDGTVQTELTAGVLTFDADEVGAVSSSRIPPARTGTTICV